MNNLWPSIAVILSNLKGSTTSPLHFPAQFEEDVRNGNGERDEPVIPPFIQDKIIRRVSARQADFGKVPTSGQIWRFDASTDNNAPLCVLLDKEIALGLWQGWVVAPETDYATDQDVILEPSDEPFDPIAAMVQTWNPIDVEIKNANLVLAKLSNERMEAVREVARGEVFTEISARPGFISPMRTHSGASVLSGTCLGNSTDPRREYRQIYLEFAAIKSSHNASIADQDNIISLMSRIRRIAQPVGWAVAASILIAQSIVIFNLMNSQPMNLSQPYSEYRSDTAAPSDKLFLEVFFKPDTKEIEIRKLLSQNSAIIVSGPEQFGQYRIQIDALNQQKVIELFKASGLVDSIEVSR